MASQVSTEVFAGLLLGQGQKVTCMVSADKVTQKGSKEVSFTNYRVRHVYESAAEGEYQLAVNGTTFQAQRQNGQWQIATESTIPERSDVVAIYAAPAFP